MQAVRQPPAATTPETGSAFVDLPVELQRNVLKAAVGLAGATRNRERSARNLAQIRNVNASFRTLTDEILQETPHADVARSMMKNTVRRLLRDFTTLPDDAAFEKALQQVLENKTDVAIDLSKPLPWASKSIVRRHGLLLKALAEKTDFRTLEIDMPAAGSAPSLFKAEANSYQVMKYKFAVFKFLREIQQRNPGLAHFSLNLKASPLDDSELAALAKLTSLTHLEICASPIANTGLKELAKLTNLETLAIFPHKKLDEESVRALGSSTKLKTLSLKGGVCKFPGALAVLSQTFKDSTLTELDISGNWFNDSDVSDLDLPRLTTLHISGCLLTSAGVAILEKQLPALTALSIGDNGRMTGEMADVLTERFSRLTSLDLRGNELDTAALAQLATGMPKLTRLSLASANLENVEVGKALSNLKTLTYLDLQYTGVDEKDLLELAALPQLAELNIRQNHFSAACIPMLAQLRQLERLHLSNVGQDDRFWDLLKAGLPDVEIIVPRQNF